MSAREIKGANRQHAPARWMMDGWTRGVWLADRSPTRSVELRVPPCGRKRFALRYTLTHPRGQSAAWSVSGELVRFEPENTHARRRQPPTGATPLRFARRLAMALKILGWGTMVGVAFLAITSLKTWMAPLASRAAQMVQTTRGEGGKSGDVERDRGGVGGATAPFFESVVFML